MLNKAQEYEAAKQAANYEYTMTEIGMRHGVDRKVISRRKKKYENLNEFEHFISNYFQLLLTEKDTLDDLLDYVELQELATFVEFNMVDFSNLTDEEWEHEIDEFHTSNKDISIAKFKQFVEDTNEVAKTESLVESANSIKSELESVDSNGIDWSKAPEGFDYYIVDHLNPMFSGFHKKEGNEYKDNNGGFYTGDVETETDCYEIFKRPTVSDLIKEKMEGTNEKVYPSQNTDSRVDVDVEYDAVITPSSIDVVKTTLKDDGETVTDQRVISQGNPQFKKAWTIIREAGGDLTQDTIRKVYDVADIKAYIGQITKGNLVIDFDNETATYKNFPINQMMVKRIITEAFDDTNGKVSDKIVNFFEKVLDNPSERSVNNLYDFLKHNDIAIHEDGDIVGYKMVRNDRYDFHSGKFYNGDGETIWMPRHEVDCEPNNTCSRGLHVCAKDYIGFYGTSTVIEVKVNPKDVCAVPYDYNGSKMRVNEYTVIGETTKRDILEENESRPTDW